MELSEREREKMEEVIACVCEYFDVDILVTTERHGKYQTCSNARHFCWYILHYDLGISIRLIGKRFKRKENTIKKGVAKIKSGIRQQRYYRDKFHDLQRRTADIYKD